MGELYCSQGMCKARVPEPAPGGWPVTCPKCRTALYPRDVLERMAYEELAPNRAILLRKTPSGLVEALESDLLAAEAPSLLDALLEEAGALDEVEEVRGDKHLFLWRPPSGTSIPTFARDALTRIDRVTRGLGPRVVHLTTETPPRLNVVPYRREPLAMIALFGDPARATARLRALPGRLAGYRVDESVPVARDPRDRPGATLLTLFEKNPKLDRDAFFAEWYGKHTPLSLEIHPLSGYVRNAVAAAVVDGSFPWDGIVSEDVARREELLDPRHLFGGALAMVPNMIRVARHVSHFLNMASIETYLVSEHRLEG